MICKSHLVTALIFSLSAGLTAAPGRAQVSSESAVRTAQSGEYLPPVERRGAPPPPDSYDAPQRITPRRDDAPLPPPPYGGQGERDGNYGREATAPDDLPPRNSRGDGAPPPPYSDSTYSVEEVVDAGHRFFGGVSKGLATVVEYTFSQQGRPNGYILGEEAGGAIVAGLRYGEGRLFTKSFGTQRVYWQGPSFGYDFGAEGSKTLILVYNLEDANQIYNRFAGVDGSAYLVGGVGVTFQTYDNVVLAPIRSGVGVRLGANVGYLKYTREPTWNPF
jgi:hypothetical protein